MPLRRSPARLSPLAVPASVVGLAAVVAVAVPSLVALTGPLSLARASVLALVILILTVSYGVPYAAAVAVGTVPVVGLGVAGFAPPEAVAPGTGWSRRRVAVAHAAVGFCYALAAAFVGSLLLGAEMAGGSSVAPALGDALGVPVGTVAGGVAVGGAFVALQLWRCRGVGVPLDRRTVATTAALGALLVPSPATAYWLFGGAFGGL